MNNKFGKYLLYALGEVLLIIIGILIVVNINNSTKESRENKLRCTYLNELLYTFEYDIKDVEGNLRGFELWNPKISDILSGIENKNLTEVDSLYDKLGSVGNYIFFGQRSKTKIEELKYSPVNLIENRVLKNRILLYQNETIFFLRHLEERYDLLGEDLRKYYANNFDGYNYTRAIPLNINELVKDNYYRFLVSSRLKMNRRFIKLYEALAIEQKDIKQLIFKDINEHCTDGAMKG